MKNARMKNLNVCLSLKVIVSLGLRGRQHQINVKLVVTLQDRRHQIKLKVIVDSRGQQHQIKVKVIVTCEARSIKK